MPPDSMPALAAVLSNEQPRTQSLRLKLRRRELQQLQQFAAAAGVPTASLGHALLTAGLSRLIEEQAACTLQEAA